MPAFEHAVGLGYRYLETDVHATVDGVLLAFHDDRLDRVTDRQGEIAALPHAEVAAARVDGREPIPLLEDLLGSFPTARINIDPKHDGSVGTAHRRPPAHRRRRPRVHRLVLGRSGCAPCETVSGPGSARRSDPRRWPASASTPLSGRVHPSPAGCVQIPEQSAG